MWLFEKKAPRLRRPLWTRDRWKPSQVLMRYSRNDAWTLQNAYEGTLIVGGTGSGKTTGSGHAIADSFLRSDMGGLVLTSKPGERQQWEGYCKAAGRHRDLIVFGADQPWHFNFLNYAQRLGGGAGHTENLLGLFSTILEMADATPAGVAVARMRATGGDPCSNSSGT